MACGLIFVPICGAEVGVEPKSMQEAFKLPTLGAKGQCFADMVSLSGNQIDLLPS